MRALYDFQPTEQGELGFEKGDIIRVIESVYRDWWKGELRGKTGIFPVNYVEKIVDPSPSDIAKEASIENEVMNETRNIDRLLEMLSSTDPRARDSFSDNEELQNLYNSTLSIRPKLVKLIEKYSLKKDELVALNEKFMQARTMYDGMLSNSIARYSSAPAAGSYGYPPQQQQQQQQQPYSNGNYGYQSPATSSNQNYTPQPQHQQQPIYGYQPQQQQQQSPAPQNQSAPIQQQPQQQQQQPAYGYDSAAPPQHQNQQQPQYDYNSQPQNQYQYEAQPQQQSQHSTDYSAQTPYSGAAAAPPAAVTSKPDQSYAAPPAQQNYGAYPASNAPTEGYPPTNYSSPGQHNQQQQQQPYNPSAGYNGQPQQAYAHNY